MNFEDIWSRLDPGFIAPIWLFAGLIAVIAVILLEIGARRRRKQALRLFAASHLVAALTGSVSPFKRVLKRVLLIIAVALLFTAMARPHLFFNWREENRTGLDILLAVDCSKSMLTEDVKPSRLERAKLAISDFADQLPNNRLGLIAFAGDAFLQCPLTLDHDAFQTAVQELDTDVIPRPGTDIATGIQEAVLALKSQPNNQKILILITDGEDLEGGDIAAAHEAAQSGLKIFTVGVGTPAGGMIPERDDAGAITYHHDANGDIVQSKLDESSLKEIASITGGAYVALGQQGEGLEQIYKQYIEPLPKQNLEERREKVPLEWFEWPLALAMVFLVWEFLTTERAKRPVLAGPIATNAPRRVPRRRNRIVRASATVPLLAGSLLLGAITSSHASDATTAEKEYKSGDYSSAVDNYRKATETQPDRTDLKFNLGDAAYKSGDYTEAEDSFRKTLNTPDLNLQESTYYNLGNTQFKHGEALEKVDRKKTIDLWEQALKSYDSSLKLKNSADAKYNYDVVKKKLEELKQQQQQQDQKDKDNKNQSDKDKNQSSKNDSKSGQGGKDKDKDKGQSSQNQPGQNNPQNGNSQDPSQSQKPDDQGGQDQKPGNQGQDQNQGQPNPGQDKNAPVKAYSGTRGQDKNDPGAKSRQEAIDLLDSLKDDEKHVTARMFNDQTDSPPPPPPSGKDW